VLDFLHKSTENERLQNYSISVISVSIKNSRILSTSAGFQENVKSFSLKYISKRYIQ